MHPCPGNWVGIGHAVMYYVRSARAFSAGIKCRHCTYIHTYIYIYIYMVSGTLNNSNFYSFKSYWIFGILGIFSKFQTSKPY